MSCVTFLVFAVDKRGAVWGTWRVRERTLHQLGAAGGWPGGLLAMKVLRHKTIDRPFRRGFFAMIAVHIAAVATICYFVSR